MGHGRSIVQVSRRAGAEPHIPEGWVVVPLRPAHHAAKHGPGSGRDREADKESTMVNKEAIVHGSPDRTSAPALEALLASGVLTGAWVLDPRTSSFRLESRSMGLIRVNGVFRDVKGNGTVSAQGEVSGTITVSAASIDTKVTKRDEHLRSAEFFDVGNSPDITFAVHRIRLAGQGVSVTGALTVRDHTRPVFFDAAVSVRGDREIRLDAEVSINRYDFGLTWNFMGMASKKATVAIQATFTRPDD
jgi:polyisoprenoid-binding protein YceI